MKGLHLSFRADDVLGASGAPIQTVCIVKSGLASAVVRTEDGAQIQTALVVRGGLLGGAVYFGSSQWLNPIVWQTAGAVLAVDRHAFCSAVNDDAALRESILRHEEWLFVQAQQAAACNAKHTIEARLCSFLLHAHALSELKELPFTQERLAEMLGAERTAT